MKLIHFAKSLDVFSKSDIDMVFKPVHFNRGNDIMLNVSTTNYEYFWKQAVDAIQDKAQKYSITTYD